MNKQLLWVFLIAIVIYILTRYREGFYNTERPMLTNEDLTNFYPNGTAPVRTTANARIFLDWLKTKLGPQYNEAMLRESLGSVFEQSFKKDITPLVNAVKSLDKKPTPTEFINKLNGLIPADFGLSKATIVDMFNDPHPNQFNMAYEYLFGATTEKAKLEETPTATTPTTTPTTTPATTVDPKPARVSPMVRTNMAAGYDPRPYSDFPKCNPNYRAIPGGTIEEKCFS